MKGSSVVLISVALMATAIFLAPIHACDPEVAQAAIRVRVLQILTMYPNIYQDIISGRLVPSNRPGNMNGQMPNGFMQPQPGVYPYGGQMQPGVYPYGGQTQPGYNPYGGQMQPGYNPYGGQQPYSQPMVQPMTQPMVQPVPAAG